MTGPIRSLTSYSTRRFDSLHPSGIAFCGTAPMSSTCMAFVKKFKMRFRVRSGGHSYAGWSSLDNGLVIDVSRISHFSVGNGTVTVGAGIDLIHLYEQLAAHGLAIPGGSCPSVGLAGLALGGGIGVLGRQSGLPVTSSSRCRSSPPTASVLNCDSKHPHRPAVGQPGRRRRQLRRHDLVHAAHAQAEFARAVFPAMAVVTSWPGDQRLAVLGTARTGRAVVQHARVSAFGGSPVITVGGTWIGSVVRRDRVIRSLINRVGATPISTLCARRSFLTAMLVEAGCSGLSVPPVQHPARRGAAQGSVVRQVGLLLRPALGCPDPGSASRRSNWRARFGAARLAEAPRSRSTPWAARSTGSTRRPRRSCTATRCGDPVLDIVDRPRLVEREPGGAPVAAFRLRRCAPARQRRGLPELRRPRPDELASGLLRRELPQAGQDQEALRPGQPLQLPPVHHRLAPSQRPHGFAH